MIHERTIKKRIRIFTGHWPTGAGRHVKAGHPHLRSNTRQMPLKGCSVVGRYSSTANPECLNVCNPTFPFVHKATNSRFLFPPIRAWLEQPHGRRHKAPPQPCALTTNGQRRRLLSLLTADDPTSSSLGVSGAEKSPSISRGTTRERDRPPLARTTNCSQQRIITNMCSRRSVVHQASKQARRRQEGRGDEEGNHNSNGQIKELHRLTSNSR